MARRNRLPIRISAREPVAILVCFALVLAAVGVCEGPCWATAVEGAVAAAVPPAS